MLQCYNYNKLRHYASDCWSQTVDRYEQSNLAEATNQEKKVSTLFLAREDEHDKQDVWYLHSGASNHMCGKRELFEELEDVHGNVSLRDSSKLSVKGKGKIKIYQKNGMPSYISNVYYVPNMKNNILSIGQLLEKGYVIHMEKFSFIKRCEWETYCTSSNGEDDSPSLS